MRNKRLFIFIAVFIVLGLVACSSDITSSDTGRFSKKSTGQIYLYGELHGDENIGKRV